MKTLTCTATLVLLASTLSAQEVLFEDHFDGDTIHSSLEIEAQVGNRELLDGQWVWSANNGDYVSSHVAMDIQDYSITTQVQTLDAPSNWVFLGLYGRGTLLSPEYWGGVDSDGTLSMGYYDGSQIHRTPDAVLGLDTAAGVNLRFDIVDDTIRLWGWQVGEEQPAEHHLELVDSSITTGAGIGMFYNPGPGNQRSPGRVGFEYLRVATVPEPSGWGLMAATLGLTGLCRKRRVMRIV